MIIHLLKNKTTSCSPKLFECRWIASLHEPAIIASRDAWTILESNCRGENERSLITLLLTYTLPIQNSAIYLIKLIYTPVEGDTIIVIDIQ